MQNSRILPASDVVTFDRKGFVEACASLMDLVMQDGKPDALIGIRTGGLYVAEAMASSVAESVPVLSLTCRRPSSQQKDKLASVKKLIAQLPRPMLDQLRVIEHKILTGGTHSLDRDAFQFDAEELARLDDWLSRSGRAPSLVVVDDAVDSGATLSLVLEAVGQHAPAMANIRSAVITVTTPRPWALPRYTLYRRQLCRFPWSLDAA